MEKTNGRGLNIIIEMQASVNLNKDLKMLAPKGTVVVVGGRNPTEINPRLMMGKETKIQGIALGSATKEEYGQMRSAIEEGVRQGWIDPRIGCEYPINDVVQAHINVSGATGKKGKIILVV